MPGAAEAAPKPAPPPPPPKPATDGVVGRIRVHPAGYGFVERDDGEADVFVPARFRGNALDGDRVRVATWVGYKGTEGRVEEVVQRGRAKLTGLLRALGHTMILEPDDPRIATTWGHVALEEDPGPAHEGQCVVAEIVKYPATGGGVLTARVIHVLGHPDDPRTEVAKIIACADIPSDFPDEVLQAARRSHQELVASDFADRVDLRDREFLTIDPETARDFDDAVYVEELSGGTFRVWVAVADVSHYVPAGSALDREATVRGCSVYLPDRAIPMLPKELSAGICSLNPEVDRLAMIVRQDVDAGGGLLGEPYFCAGVIRSHARLDYPGVAAALGSDFRGPRARYKQWEPALQRMNKLARKLRERRRARGALELDLPEAHVVLDEDDPRRVRDVRRSKASPEIKVAYQMIEEYMLLANEAVASFFQSRGLDTMWRVHDVPSLERLESFAELAAGFGLEIDPESAQSPLALAAVLSELAGKPYEKPLSFLLLRSLKQASYDVVNIGHFGLASKAYLHFTSPIRRYPDLIVHRLLKVQLRKEGQASGGRSHAPAPPRDQLAMIAADSSAHERRAQEAEREVVDMYRAFLMRDRLQEELDATVSGVTSYGVFVECAAPYVEGLIKLDQLGGEGGWWFDERKMRLVARRSGHALSLGDAVRVRIENVSVPRRRIDMALLSGGSVLEDAEIPRQRAARPRREPPRAAGRGERTRDRGRDRERDRQRESARDGKREGARGRKSGGGGGGGGRGGKGKGGRRR
jgi:ribonuclease R